MNLLLIDDEKMMLEMLTDAVAEVLPSANRVCFTNSNEGLDYAKKNPIDIAFLDINLMGSSGLDVARKLSQLYPKVNIIFCTGYEEYAIEAFKMYASAFIQKPIWVEDIRDAVEHLRYPLEGELKRLRFHCFGNFEAYCDGKPIVFERKRTLELLAYLVDRGGVECSAHEIMAALFEDDNKRRYYNYLRNDLIYSFEKLGLSDCLLMNRNGIGIVKDKVECDYFNYLDGKIKQPPTEYMSQFSFAEQTFGELLQLNIQ